MTETLFEIGVGDCLVGVTNFCVFPPTNLPRLGGTKTPRVNAIRELSPNLVYVNVEENLSHHADSIRVFAPVFATHPKSVSDVMSLVHILGEIHQKASRAEVLADEIKAEAERQPRNAFTFAVPIWKHPWMWCGGDTYVSDLVSSVGGTNILAGEQRYPIRSVDEILGQSPDIIFLPDEPFVFRPEDAAALQEAGAARVVGPFPGHLFTWHGSRTLLGLRFLHQVL